MCVWRSCDDNKLKCSGVREKRLGVLVDFGGWVVVGGIVGFRGMTLNDGGEGEEVGKGEDEGEVEDFCG